MFTLRDSDVFLTFWNETDGIWKKFPVDKATNINDVNVNDYVRYNDNKSDNIDNIIQDDEYASNIPLNNGGLSRWSPPGLLSIWS